MGTQIHKTFNSLYIHNLPSWKTIADNIIYPMGKWLNFSKKLVWKAYQKIV